MTSRSDVSLTTSIGKRMGDAPTRFNRWVQVASRLVLRRPFRVLAGLLVLVVCIEVLQNVQEVFPGGHALGEIIRNLAYAIIGALVFQWLVVELPARERRRKSYDFNRQAYGWLLAAGPMLLESYRYNANRIGQPLDVWDHKAFMKFANTVMSPSLSTSTDRLKLVKTQVEVVIPRALSQLSVSVAYMDDDVAHALSMFPRQDGFTTVLQARPTSTGGIEPQQDAGITWTLLEASRRLYPALLGSSAFDSTVFGAKVTHSDGNETQISDDSILRPNGDDVSSGGDTRASRGAGQDCLDSGDA